MKLITWNIQWGHVIYWRVDLERIVRTAREMADFDVLCLQEVARRTGRELMDEWIGKLEYGNRDIRGGIDLFWLQGALRVSAREQVDFLRKLAEGSLPMTQRSQRLVREALVVERARDYTLYAKTGTSGSKRSDVCWWVGWVERKGRVDAVFAMNFAPAGATKFEDRFAIGRAILEEAKALPSGSRPS